MTQIPQPEFGQRLRRLRAERGLSQRDLAVGVVNQSYISLLESGARVPTLDVVVHLAKVLDVPLSAIVGDIGVSVDVAEAPKRSQLVDGLLTASAIEHGDLVQAEQRLTEAYRTAVAGGGQTAVLTHGLALERVLELRGDRAGRYALLNELLPVAEESDIVEARVRVRVALSAAARDAGRLDQAFTQIERAGQEIIHSEFLNGSEHVRLLAVHISVLSDAGGGAEIVRLVDAMLTMAEVLGSSAISGRAQWVASIALAGVGETDRSLKLLRGARQMLSDPGTSLRDWARFSRAAVSALMDSGADPAEITTTMLAARAATAAESGVEANRLAGLEVRYAVAIGEPDRAVELAAAVDEDQLAGVDGVRFLHALGSALRRTGREVEAVATLRRAAQKAETTSAYRWAARIWREINDAPPYVMS